MIMSNKKPEIVVFAGPNGSGKSTFTKLLKPPSFSYINADEIKKNLQCSDLEASQKAEELRERKLADNENFCFETVLSTTRNLDLLKRAKAKGYFIRCYYVITSDPFINSVRIDKRVLSGGHGVPKEKIYSRYYKSLALMKDVIAVCDICHVYDNSARPFRIFKKRKTERFFQPDRAWDAEKIREYTGSDKMTAKDLNLAK